MEAERAAAVHIDAPAESSSPSRRRRAVQVSPPPLAAAVRRWPSLPRAAAGLAAAALLLHLALSAPSAEEIAAPLVLRSPGGVEVHVLRVGAAIQRLLVPDRRGVRRDVALGFDEARQYAEPGTPYFGAVVGRVANRIANATFTIDGRTHRLSQNEAGFPGCLHGGVRGFDKVVWDAAPLQRRADGSASLRLTYRSPDGEEGFPGAVSVEVTYTLSKGGELALDIAATADRATPVNLAQHAYFNLAGHASGDVLGHELTLHGAAHVLPVDSARIPTGEFRAVAGTPYDFSKPRAVGSRIDEVDGPGWSGGYDSCYVLHGLGAAVREHVQSGAMAVPFPQLAATLHHPPSGRVMEVLTTAPGLQLYTGNFLDGTLRGKGGTWYGRHSGLCLETQGLPDSVNQPAFPSTVLRPGEAYRHRTVYRFSAR